MIWYASDLKHPDYQITSRKPALENIRTIRECVKITPLPPTTRNAFRYLASLADDSSGLRAVDVEAAGTRGCDPDEWPVKFQGEGTP